jgi:hypothetical protein
MTNQTVDVTFMHPRDSSQTLAADIGVDVTAQEVIDELMRDADGTGPFLPPLEVGEDYLLSLKRTKKAISPDMTFAQAGVTTGDAIAVVKNAIGAAA